MNPVHTLPPTFRKIYSLSPPSGLLHSIFPTKVYVFYVFLICPIRITCLAHLILLNLMTLIIFGEAYKL